jgi:hypothetical protein
MFKPMFAILLDVWEAVTKHNDPHAVEHIGQFAGSLLPSVDWNR